jgi:Fic family protein
MNPDAISEDAPGEVELADGAWTYNPDPLPPDIEPDHELTRLHSEAEFGLGKLNNVEAWLDDPQIVLSPLIHKEAADSSDIETISRVTVEDIYLQEAGESPARNAKEMQDFIEAANYVKSIRAGMGRLENGQIIDVDLICDLHGILLGGVRGESKNPGEFRDHIVGVDEEGTSVSEARFVPMAPAKIPWALERLLEYVRKGGTYPDLMDIALIHYQFETIHPFRDGNGRVGRLLIMLILHEWGKLPGPYLYPSAYFNANKEEYYQRLLSVNRGGEWRDWVEFFLTAIVSQSTEAFYLARELNELREKYERQYDGRGPVIQELVDYIVEQPFFSEPQAAEAIGRSQPAVNTAIHELWDDGVIIETTGKETHRRYRAEEVMRIIAPYT